MKSPSFITIACGAERPLAIWSDDLTVLAFHTETDLPSELAGLPRWTYLVPVTQIPNSDVSKSGYPIFDEAYRPLWSGARIRMRWGTVANADEDDAVYHGTDVYQQSSVTTAKEHMRYGRDICLGMTREHTGLASTYEANGLHPGAIILRRTIGSMHEWGVDTHFIRLLDDPRDVCKRVRRPRQTGRTSSLKDPGHAPNR